MTAALIRNIAFEKEVFCKEIVNFKGVEAMTKVSVWYGDGGGSE